MATTYEYVYVLDNNGRVCTDNSANPIIIQVIAITSQGVTVKRVRNMLFPCYMCKYKNNTKFPATDIHMIQQDNQNYFQNVRSGCDSDFAYIYGECSDFSERT